MEAAPVLAKPRGAVEHEPPRLVPERAHRRLAADAVPAPAARRDVARADVVARRYGLDPRPDLLDHARGLVTEHDGQRMGRVTRDHVQVTVADAVGRPPHLHLVGPGSSSSTSSTTTGFFTSYRTAAVTRMAPSPFG